MNNISELKRFSRFVDQLIPRSKKKKIMPKPTKNQVEKVEQVECIGQMKIS